MHSFNKKSHVVSAAIFGLFAAIPATAIAQQEVTPAEITISEAEQAMIDWVDQNRQSIIDELSQHVGMNTGTENIEGIDAYRDVLQADLEELGFATEIHTADSVEILTCKGGEMAFADNLVGRIEGNSPRRIFLNGHMDTVFPAGDEFQELVIEEDGTLKGPGVGDMKGGIVVMLNALRAINEQGLLDDANITVAFNSDEEIGSLGSRELILALAEENDVGLIFESSPPGKMTRERKGLGQARLLVRGREAHAGANHEEGVSANLEMAHKIIEVEKLTDYDKGSTVNTGTMSGGEKRNTIPGCAEAYIDMRYLTPEAGEELKAGIEEIAATTVVSNPDYPDVPAVESWVVLHRPVKEQNDEVDALIAEAMGLSAQLGGEPITETDVSGGGTDGSIAQSVGLPSIDGLGVMSTGIHSSREESTVDSLIASTKMAAIMIARQIQQGE
ncbi:M20 family metallopeptidase [Paracoccus aerodenitrificans]|uniref:M20 family metallopeptidase n=1 Tax=Paracoccus aerodenitrificans TaxID=3017781 RepID=UPI0022F0986D|nr:M20 family metallopeptidase [Paracoccus aerodenitrificans]WBU62878.1 M20 family metallopeptidase [Paracoccus aerodenitrificans]